MSRAEWSRSWSEELCPPRPPQPLANSRLTAVGIRLPSSLPLEDERLLIAVTLHCGKLEQPKRHAHIPRCLSAPLQQTSGQLAFGGAILGAICLVEIDRAASHDAPIFLYSRRLKLRHETKCKTHFQRPSSWASSESASDHSVKSTRTYRLGPSSGQTFTNNVLA
jgi:hypothetical protein